MFALIDCNNFYCSCERVFQPEYQNMGVVVLSSNDGCIVARSQEVKDLDVPMGAPYFQYRALLHRHRVAVFSCNFALYGDMSGRVMQTITQFYPSVEIYSIDECFIKLMPNAQNALSVEMEHLRQIVHQWTGIPISVGIAPTKTLAKLANLMAKKHKEGVVDARDSEALHLMMQRPVSDIWGVGRRLSEKLEQLDILTVADFCRQDRGWMRQHFGVVGQRLQAELLGQPCADLVAWQPKKSVVISRSFSQKVDDFDNLNAALSRFVTSAAEKVRLQGSVVQAVQVFLHQVPTIPTGKLYQHVHNTGGLEFPSNDPVILLQMTKRLVQGLYQKNARYRKAGVILMDLISDKGRQGDLFETDQPPEREKLLQNIDCINRRMGAKTLKFAVEDTGQKARPRQENRSKNFTTRWKDIPEARCSV